LVVPSLELTPGSFFAQDFRVVSALGKGGMGVVYVVEQLSTGKKRALKLMQPTAAADATLRERFVREARVGAMIDSEHVVEVIGAGVDQWTGVPWLAMELLEGEDLGTFVRRRGAVPPAEAHEILAQLCHGLSAAHAIPVVHRDLKPENIFLSRPRREGARVLVKILDFGIAKIVTPNATATTTMGTPLWMAPEQASTKTRISPATDVWALGLVAFFMLTGRLYWREQTSPMELLQEVVVLPLEPPSVRAGAVGARAAPPPGFDAWFSRCVARDPAARFPNAGEAWRALSPILGGGALDPGRSSGIPASAMGAPAPSSFGQATVAGGPPAAGAWAPQASGRPSYPQGSGNIPPASRTAPSPGAGSGGAIGAIAIGGVLLVVVIAAGIFVAVRAAGTGGAKGGAASASGSAGGVSSGGASPHDEGAGAMVRFSGGTFLVGDDALAPSAPRHKATVGPFSLDVTEVTVRAYKRCVAAGACTAPLTSAGSNWNIEARQNHPVNFVDWTQAKAFCAFAGKRLPTEEEWEFAASGGVAQRSYPWGIGDPTLGVCFGKGTSASTCEVKKSLQDVTAEGVFDMAANVDEWTDSRFCPYSQPGCSGDGGQPLRVVRGGSFSQSTAQAFHNTARVGVFEGGSSATTGIRCAR
jgi:formylglycine-generating enzyme required for sulfatase activity/tRNA A-37 threonylcarbamoyl transferase component Bud32